MNGERDCRDVRQALALGEADSVQDHLALCASCREEAEMVGSIFAELERGQAVAPPAQVDRAVRRVIGKSSSRLRLLPIPAVLMAACALVSLVTILAGLLSTTSISDAAPLIAIAGTGAYLALCVVATAPILLLHGKRRLILLSENSA